VSALQLLCEIDPPEVAWPEIEAGDSAVELGNLLRFGALVEDRLRQSITCLACDVPHSVCVEYRDAGTYRAYCPDVGYHQLRAEDLRVYRLDENWITARIALSVGLKPGRGSKDDRPDYLRIGRARFGRYPCELFFARRLFSKPRFLQVAKRIADLAGLNPSVLVTSTPLDLIPGNPPARCGLVFLDDILDVRDGKIVVDEGPFHAVLRGNQQSSTGAIGFEFSTGYRSAQVGDTAYTFTDKQALVIEALFGASSRRNPKLHQTELQGAAHSNQRIGQLFRRHPAYGTLIKHDSQGYYWLDV
jgi:hypothetical protein